MVCSGARVFACRVGGGSAKVWRRWDPELYTLNFQRSTPNTNTKHKHVCEPQIRARLGTTAHFCKLRAVAGFEEKRLDGEITRLLSGAKDAILNPGEKRENLY